MFLHSAYDPCPPLDRRWLRAGYLLANALPPSAEHDDAWVEQALGYRKALATCSDEAGRLALADAMPAVHQAHALHQADPPLLRWAAEAYLLAREPFDRAARRCGLLPEAVEAFERLFFAVRDKLDADLWVLCHVIGRKAFCGLTEQDLDVLWRLVGFYFGPVMLDALLLGTPGLPQPATTEELAPALDRHADVRVALQKAVALQMLPVTPETAPEVLRVLSQLNPAGPAANAGGGTAPLAASLEGLLGQATVQDGAKSLPGPQETKFTRMAV